MFYHCLEKSNFFEHDYAKQFIKAKPYILKDMKRETFKVVLFLAVL